jgi:hypothetical protein
MKCSGLSLFGGVVLLALIPVSAMAHVDVNVDLGAPGYVEPPPVYYDPPRRYYSAPPPVYYGPRVIYRDRQGRCHPNNCQGRDWEGERQRCHPNNCRGSGHHHRHHHDD